MSDISDDPLDLNDGDDLPSLSDSQNTETVRKTKTPQQGKFASFCDQLIDFIVSTLAASRLWSHVFFGQY